MRSIGKVKIKKLRQIVQDEMKKNPHITCNMIIHTLPPEWFDIWEGAHSEITNIILDEAWKA